MANQNQNDQNRDQQGKFASGQQGSSNVSRGELETIIREGKWNTQAEANQHLQKYGLSCRMRDDGTAEILEGDTSIANVSFTEGSGSVQRSINSIEYGKQQNDSQQSNQSR